MPPVPPALDPDLDFQQAVSLQQAGRLAEAAALYRVLLARFPDHPRLLNNLGAVLLQLGDLEASLLLLEKTLGIDPAQPLALLNLGIGLHKLERPAEALAVLERGIALKPDIAALHYRRASLLQELGRSDAALESAETAIALAPRHLEAHLVRGGALLSLNRFDAALAGFQRAIDLRPDCVNAHLYRGETFKDLKRFDEALACHERAIASQADSAEAHWSKSNLLLLMGHYAEGWRLHEWRWKSEYFRKFRRDFTQPLWLGESPLAGRTLLIHGEGGLGDVLQKCRYVPLAVAQGARVIFEVPAALRRLMACFEGEVRVITRGDPLPAFDLHCPTMSLPLAFGTTLKTLPGDVPYLRVDEAATRTWQDRLGSRTRPRIGLAWSGAIRKDIDPNPARKRSISLALLAPILQLPLEFHALQKHLLPEEAATLAGLPQIHQHQDALEDFSDTAALMQALDLVITIDTSVAHLSGALGRADQVLLPFAPDYRWTAAGDSTPWYPSLKLFRQSAIGDWSGVLAEVEAGLRAMVSRL